MKYKFIKLVVLALTLVATCAAMVVPSMAAEPSGFVFVQFENPDHAEHVRFKSTDAFTYDASTGRVASTGLGTSDFYLSLSPSLTPTSGCYYFSFGLWSGSPYEALNFVLKYRYDGWECTMFDASNGILKQSGTEIGSFSDGTMLYLSCFVDAVGKKAYYTVVDENGDGLMPFTMIDLAAIGKPAVETSNRLLYIYCKNTTPTGYCVFSDITVYEVPSSTLKAFGETALGGYDDGYTDGYTDGSNDGWDSCVNDLYDTVYNEGYAAGKTEGYKNGYEWGYSDGYEWGYYEEGYPDGLEVGKEEGFAQGLEVGYANGKKDGEQIGYDQGYQEGRDVGHGQGYDQGYDQGSSDGYILGYGEGERVGYNLGIQDSNFVFDAVNGVWHGAIEAYETLANGISIFNVTLGSVVTTAGVLLLVTFIVKVVRGS